MKFLIVLAAAFAVSNAKFETGIAVCPGYESYPFQFIKASMPEVFTFPGSAKLSYHAIRKQDLPTDLVMDFKLRKVSVPVPYDVPCTAGQGSCVYEVCSAEYFTKELGVCEQYPSFQNCGCPFKAGEVKLTDIEYPLPALGDWASVIAGDFEGKAFFYGKSAPDTILGCVNIAFSVAAA